MPTTMRGVLQLSHSVKVMYLMCTKRERKGKRESERMKVNLNFMPHIISCLDNVAPHKAIIFILSSALDTSGVVLSRTSYHILYYISARIAQCEGAVCEAVHKFVLP